MQCIVIQTYKLQITKKKNLNFLHYRKLLASNLNLYTTVFIRTETFK